ncbi:zinc ribbon domain-containing protein [Paraburkholderia sp. BR14320]|uniref:zinc ribbon domain-containing protein n=1 Tax=unclassified Paraburkholderia TaxID=2615204 RepID=UPI0034CDEEA6
MRCTNCGFDNLSRARVCEACVTMLTCVCPRCGRGSAATARFCSKCGAPLSETPEPASSVQQPPPAPVNYTPHHLAERIRAEHVAMEARGETRAALRGYLSTLQHRHSRGVSLSSLLTKASGSRSEPKCAKEQR